jgi:hypothetical protein
MSVILPGPCGGLLNFEPIDEGTLARVCHAQPGWYVYQFHPWHSPGKTLSGKHWVDWAEENARNSAALDDLVDPFKTNVKSFITALEGAGADVEVRATRRDPKRAYLFHWSWLIALGKRKPSSAMPMTGVDIEWDHGDSVKSQAGAGEMVKGFGLAVPPKSSVAPAIASNHIAGKAIDMDITWEGDLKVKKKDGSEVSVAYMEDPNLNTKLHAVGESYGVKKHKRDAPHWSTTGR